MEKQSCQKKKKTFNSISLLLALPSLKMVTPNPVAMASLSFTLFLLQKCAGWTDLEYFTLEKKTSLL